MAAPTFRYDVMSYPGGSFEPTHPRRLATLAALYMRDPAPADAAPLAGIRVLELGCGDGANLIPMAHSLPGATFVGIDRAAQAIAGATAAAAAAGLANVEFLARDILTVGNELGKFDYIVAHGVYSWVPAPVQERILWLCGQLLQPRGVAYISYNAQPGGHIRQVPRDLMLYHTRHETDPHEQIRKARAISAAIVDAVRPSETVYRGLLTSERDRLAELDLHVLFHDDLAPDNEALYLHQFVDRARRHGLQYLADADFASMHPHRFPAAAAALLAQCQDRVEYEQYLDFMSGRAFRRTLLCRAELALAPAPQPERVETLWARGEVSCQTQPVDLVGEQAARFRGPSGIVVGLTDPWAKAALLLLGESFPFPLRFGELLDGVRRRLAAAGASLPAPEPLRSGLGELLLNLYSGNLIQLHAQVPAVARSVGERPLLSPLVHRQAQRSAMLVNVWHHNVLLDNELALRLLPLLDGTRTQDELLAALAMQRDAPPVSASELSAALQRLLQLGLLGAPASATDGASDL
jgi:SAM-dependent methyltransferase